MSAKAREVLREQGNIETEISKVVPQRGDWASLTQSRVNAAASFDEASRILLDQYALAYELIIRAVDVTKLLGPLFPLRYKYLQEQNTMLADKLYRKAVTFDFVHQRPADQPQLNQFRLVFSTPLGRKPDSFSAERNPGPRVNLNVNAGFTFFAGGNPVASSRGSIRDAQLSSALEFRLGSPTSKIPATATLAGYYQYMLENAVIQFNSEAVTPGAAGITLPKGAIELLNTTGHIGIGQFRVSIPIGDSGVSFPFALSYSNRVELITGKPFWQGHVGVTYDLSKLRDFFGARTP